METLKAKMKSLTKSFGEDESTVLNYNGQECILINNQNRKFVFENEDGKMFVFISSNPNSIKEIFNDTEIEIKFDVLDLGKLKMTKKIGNQKMSGIFNIRKEKFIVEDNKIHIKYKILDDNSSSYLSEVEVFIETGGN